MAASSSAGGEYTADPFGMIEKTWDSSCEIYDPVANTWTIFDSPVDSKGTTWAHIGDAPCVVLP